MLTTLALAAALTLGACGDKDDSGADDTGADDTGADDTGAGADTGAALTDACTLADEHSGCDECYSGEVTCEYDEYSATESSCGDCQARSSLYADLCSADVPDSRADIEAGTICSDPI
jgi:hypothetical protein